MKLASELVTKNIGGVKEYDWDYVKINAGLYREAKYMARVRFLTIKSTSGHRSTLWISGSDIEPAEECWKRYRFIQVFDEKLTINIEV